MKRFFFAFVLFFFLLACQAQNIGFTGSIGIGSLFNSASLAYDIDPILYQRNYRYIATDKTSPALNLGALVEVPLTRKLSFGTGLNYLMISEYWSNEFTINGKTDTRTNYKRHCSQFSLPLQLVFIRQKFQLRAGAQLGWIFSQMSSIRSYDAAENKETFTRYNFNDHALDYGYTAGLAYKMSKNIYLNLQFYQSLKRYIKRSGPILYPISLQLGVNYYLPKKVKAKSMGNPDF